MRRRRWIGYDAPNTRSSRAVVIDASWGQSTSGSRIRPDLIGSRRRPGGSSVACGAAPSRRPGWGHQGNVPTDLGLPLHPSSARLLSPLVWLGHPLTPQADHLLRPNHRAATREYSYVSHASNSECGERRSEREDSMDQVLISRLSQSRALQTRHPLSLRWSRSRTPRLLTVPTETLKTHQRKELYLRSSAQPAACICVAAFQPLGAALNSSQLTMSSYLVSDIRSVAWSPIPRITPARRCCCVEPSRAASSVRRHPR